MKLLKLIFFLFPLLTFAQIPEYYNSIDFNQTGDNLKTLLTIITRQKNLDQFKVVGVAL